MLKISNDTGFFLAGKVTGYGSEESYKLIADKRS